jgi:uncharacterized protein
MRFSQDSTSGTNVIRAYRGGELQINENRYRGAVILSASTLLAQPDIQDLESLVAVDATRILALEPEIVLLGTGARQIFPAASYSAQYLRAGIGLEVMDTGAACRTFNVLVGEQRRVVALLLA